MTFRKLFAFKSIPLVGLMFLTLSCNESHSGITVTLGLVHHASPDSEGTITAASEGDPRVFTTNLDYEVTITSAYVTVSMVHLAECETASLQLRRLWNRISLIPSAYAHTEGSSTELGVPNVEDLMRADLSSLELGQLEPAAGSYCHLHVTFSPADADALHLPTDQDMVEKTLYISGTYTPPGGGASQEFEIISAEEAETEVHLLDANGDEAPLELSLDNPSQTVTLGLTYDTWLNDVDFSSMTDDQIAEQALTNVADSATHYKGATTN